MNSAQKPLAKGDLNDMLGQTEALWRQKQGARLFVTGGTGFFGKWLQETFAFANAALNLKAEMVVLTRDPILAAKSMPHLAGITYEKGDVAEPLPALGAFSDFIYAATTVEQLWRPELVLPESEQSYQGLASVLANASATNGSRFLYVSSGAVHGSEMNANAGFREDQAELPPVTSSKKSYAQEKRACESLTLSSSRQSGHHVNIARCFAFIGPHLQLDGSFAAGQFIREALAKNPIEIKGSGRDQRSYLYASELATWLWTILFKGESGETYNVGSQTPVTIGELANEIASAFGRPPPELPATPEQPPTHYFPDVSKAFDHLGLQQRFDLHESVRRTANWWKT